MPGRISGHKRTHEEHLDDDGPYDHDSERASPFSDRDFDTPGKRQRQHHRSNDSPKRPVLPSSYRADHRQTDGAPSKQTHQPGSIVRVALKNFVTYTKAEFHLGPSLNMIIGPNGTGKSTVVCAICLGLGWKTEHLGRAKDISEFVRRGANDAEVEVELARDPARQDTNQIVKLIIKKSTNKSAFFLNGRAVARKEVINMCKAFSIQIDNLCQFLPQDRVVEFAALSPVDLLAQTLRAAAPQEMTDMHDELKELHSDSRRANDDRNTLNTSLQQHENRQNMQRTDVERLQQRNQLVEEIRALNLLIPYREYAAAREVWQDAKARRIAAQQSLDELKEQVEPSLRAVTEKQAYLEGIQAVVDKRKKLVSRSEQNASSLAQKQEDYQANITASNQAIEAEKNREKTLKSQRNQARIQMHNIKVEMEKPPPEIDSAAYNEKAREFTRQTRELTDAAQAENVKQIACVNQIKARKNQVATLKHDLESLRTQAGQMEAKLRRTSQHTVQAWAWVQDNIHLFKGPVYGPPLLTCSVKDKRHAIYLENILGKNELTTITVTNGEDQNRLEHQLFGTMELTDATIRTSAFPVSHWRPSIPSDQLAIYGLHAYLLDLVEGPEAVLSMLCEAKNIHEAAVAFKDLTNDQYEALSKSTIRAYATPNDTVTITRRREYGEHGVSSRTRRLRPAQYFNDAQADTSAGSHIEEKIKELDHEILELAEQATGHRETSQKHGERAKELEKEKKELLAEKDATQRAITQFNALPTKFSAAEDKMADCNQQLSSIAGNIKTEQDKIDTANLGSGEDALVFATNIQALQRSHVELFEAELCLIEAGSDLENLQDKNVEVQRLLDERAVQIEELRVQSVAAQQAAKTLFKKVQDIEEALTDSDREIHAAQPDDQTVDALMGEIDSRQARLDMVHEGNGNVIAEFEERAKKIERLRGKLEQLDAELAGYNGKIASIRGIWEPQLDALIHKISEAFGDNFQRIGCAGQIDVNKVEDFAEWSVQVMVKFRENEQLSVLDAHRQSGGERAVSTIFYLMALQSLARAPFRVVDEINQGMDPRNERLVHSRMVDIACAENTSQYFLITPKLLPGLDYHPKMKIHCIASGEYMPEDHKQLDFERLAQHALAVTRRLSGRA